MVKKAWERGNSRRHIRALAADVEGDAVSGTPDAQTWGAARRVQTIALEVAIRDPLISDWMQGGTQSSTVPPRPSDALDIDTLMHRIGAILEELDSGIPYGKILGAQVSFEWEQWRVAGKKGVVVRDHGKPVSSWVGTTQHLHMKRLKEEARERLEALLSQGTSFAIPGAREARPSPKFKKAPKGKKPPIEWVRVRRASIRWVVASDTHYKSRAKP